MPIGEPRIRDATFHIPGSSITRFDVDYDRGWDSMSVARREWTLSGVGPMSWYYCDETHVTTKKELTSKVKRRIYLIQDEMKIRVIALGFREADRKAIETWADADDSALALDIDPNEVSVMWLGQPT